MSEKASGFELMEPASPEALLPDSGLWPWFVAAGIVVALVIILILLLRKKKSSAVNLTKIRDAAFTEAMTALVETRTSDVRDTAVRSSMILRKYLSTAAGDPALFETHEEFVARHDALKALNVEARAATEVGFTRLAALKYAPGTPDTAPESVVAESQALLKTLHHGFAA